MRITQLSLTNFRSFAETQSIDFAPLTLLFGPNSVGKSSILMSLFYLQQILSKGQCDPVTLDALDERHVGGFENLVNGRDLNKQIVIKIAANKQGEVGATYAHLPDLIDSDFGLIVDSPTADADSMGIEFHIAWSSSSNTAYVSCCKLWLDGEQIVELSSDSGLKQPVISWLNFKHPLLNNEQDEADSDMAVTALQEILMMSGFAVPLLEPGAKDGEHYPVSFSGVAGALPLLGKRLETVISLEEPIVTARVHEILSDVIVAPLDNLLKLLNESLCIGPLRVVPDALHQISPYPQQKDWYSGAAAWDVLGRSSSQISEINYWLNSPNTLNLGYSLRTKAIKSEAAYLGGDDPESELSAILQAFKNSDLRLSISKEDIDEVPGTEEVSVDIDALKAMLLKDKELTDEKHSPYQTEEVISKIVLWDDVNKIEVTSADIGVGVSQLFPLVVAALENKRGLIACEQPELHVHPRIQVGIGDLLTQANSNSTFLIETHSEHLILRVLKRIRQTSDKELPEGYKAVTPKDVSIVYLERSDEGVKARKIDVDEDGEFVGRWPNGFFRERGEELF